MPPFTALQPHPLLSSSKKSRGLCVWGGCWDDRRIGKRGAKTRAAGTGTGAQCMQVPVHLSARLLVSDLLLIPASHDMLAKFSGFHWPWLHIFASWQIRRNSFDAEPACWSQRMTLAQLASLAYPLDQSQLPRGQDAMTGSHVYSRWGRGLDTVPRVWPPVWPGVWGKNSFPEEGLLSKQK